MSFSRNIKKVIKYSAFEILTNPLRIRKRINKIYKKEYLTILNLHRVSNNDNSAYQPLDPKIFKKLIIFLIKNFHIISFQELNKKNYQKIFEQNKPKIILSFDDGYKDFIEVVHPILIQHGIRANLNIIPSCVEKNRPPFNVILQDFIGKNNKDFYTKLDIPEYKWGGGLSKIEEGIKLSSFVKNKPFIKQLDIEKYCYEQIGQNLYKDATEMMSKQDILLIKDSHDLGAHSFSHSNMEIESDEYFLNDLNLCSQWFMDNLDICPYIYAFPNGSYKKSNLEMARENGYSQLLLVDEKFSNISNDIHPRFGFHAFSEKEMVYKSTGSLVKL